MPYIDGKRVSAEEWQARYSTATQLHTGPNGENPAEAPVIDEETNAPKSKVKKAGGKRTPRSEKAAKAALADALGVKNDSPVLADIDVTGLNPTEGDNDAD